MNARLASHLYGHCDQTFAEEHSDIVFSVSNGCGDDDGTICINCIRALAAKSDEEYREEIKAEQEREAKRKAWNEKRDRRVRRLIDKKIAAGNWPMIPRPLLTGKLYTPSQYFGHGPHSWPHNWTRLKPDWPSFDIPKPQTATFQEGEPSKYR